MSVNLFADIKTIRAAIFHIMDSGAAVDFGCQRGTWEFDPDDEGETETRHRNDFVDAVIARISDLRSIPGETIRLEDLCERHKKAALPKPTAQVCIQCSAEQKAKRYFIDPPRSTRP